MPTKSQPASATPKTTSSKKRKFVARGLPPTPGVMNLLVVKRGEDLRVNLQSRLSAMQADFEKVEFFWSKMIKDRTFNETREYSEYGQVVMDWELREGVKDVTEYKNKMKRLKVLIDHFADGMDFELTVSEVAEVLS